MDGGADIDRLRRQIAFIREIDKVKSVFRQTYLLDQSRKENDAEHSWHLAVMAVLLAEYAADSASLDLPRVIRMVLIHDLVEIDAGDTFCYDRAGEATKAAREEEAARRVFSILPADQAAEVDGLWREFEAGQTPEARYAAALDRLQPLLHNLFTGGRAWREHGVTADRVIARNRHIGQGAPALWAMAEAMIRQAVAKGNLTNA